MNRKTSPYGTFKDYPKIDIFRVDQDGLWKYVASTTWARTCKEATEAYAKQHNTHSKGDLKANFAKD